MPKLNELDLRSNEIQSVAGLTTKVPCLEILDLANNAVASDCIIDELRPIEGLVELVMLGNSVCSAVTGFIPRLLASLASLEQFNGTDVIRGLGNTSEAGLARPGTSTSIRPGSRDSGRPGSAVSGRCRPTTPITATSTEAELRPLMRPMTATKVAQGEIDLRLGCQLKDAGDIAKRDEDALAAQFAAIRTRVAAFSDGQGIITIDTAGSPVMSPSAPSSQRPELNKSPAIEKQSKVAMNIGAALVSQSRKVPRHATLGIDDDGNFVMSYRVTSGENLNEIESTAPTQNELETADAAGNSDSSTLIGESMPEDKSHSDWKPLIDDSCLIMSPELTAATAELPRPSSRRGPFKATHRQPHCEQAQSLPGTVASKNIGKLTPAPPNKEANKYYKRKGSDSSVRPLATHSPAVVSRDSSR